MNFGGGEVNICKDGVARRGLDFQKLDCALNGKVDSGHSCAVGEGAVCYQSVIRNCCTAGLRGKLAQQSERRPATAALTVRCWDMCCVQSHLLAPSSGPPNVTPGMSRDFLSAGAIQSVWSPY